MGLKIFRTRGFQFFWGGGGACFCCRRGPVLHCMSWKLKIEIYDNLYTTYMYRLDIISTMKLFEQKISF